MAQLNYIEDNGWYSIFGPNATRVHYFTADQAARDFPVSLCGKAFFDDVHPISPGHKPKCKRCESREVQR